MNKLPIDSSVGVGMSENTLKNRRTMRAYFSYKFIPFTKSERLFDRPDMVCLDRDLCLTAYAPTDYRRTDGKRIFVLKGGPANIQGLAKMRRWRSYEDFLSCASRNAFLNFVLRCTTISPLTFELAFQNIGVSIPINVIYEKYIELCGGDTLLYDYAMVEDYKMAMRVRLDAATLASAKKKLAEGK